MSGWSEGGHYASFRTVSPIDTYSGTYRVKFVIADLDFALSRGVTAHHAVIIPEKPVFKMCMNSYAASYMGRTVMPAFAMGLTAAFGPSRLLRFNADGQSCLCRLMTLSMVFGKTQKLDKSMGEEQLAAFSNNPDLSGIGMSFFDWYWLSDVCDYTHFACVDGGSNAGLASYANGGVRPFALLM